MTPYEGLEHGNEIVTTDQMREWFARQDLRGQRQHTVIARDPGGVIVGLTDTDWAPYRATIIHQQLTAVRPEARGRGLGKWVKAAMLLHLREIYPDAKWVATDNAGSNAPMLKINRELGFKPFLMGTEYQMSRDQLAERIKSL
jgi:mycothiol synthase